MNENLSRKLYPLLALSLGLVGAGCRFLLYALGMDEKGLLTPGHPAAVALWVVTGAAVLTAVLAAVTFREDNKAPDETGRPVPQALGTAVMALGVTVMSMAADHMAHMAAAMSCTDASS